jgi:hyperosmotically inducible protein
MKTKTQFARFGLATAVAAIAALSILGCNKPQVAGEPSAMAPAGGNTTTTASNTPPADTNATPMAANPPLAAADQNPAAGMSAEDSAVTTKVKSALTSDERIKSLNIAVVTQKGDVRLSGAVDNQGQIDQAIKLARGVEGVHSVQQELSIRKQ